jgi:hypothetical protein
MSLPSREALFSDDVVTPTELARHVREITQRALRRPVTIHRTDGDLALLSRERVGELIAASTAIEEVVDFGRNFLWMLQGKGRPSPAWSWLQVFQPDDVAEFIGEYLSAVEAALHGQSEWDLPHEVLHEWQESAKALGNHTLLAEWATHRGVASESEAEQLTTAELRLRLLAALESSGHRNAE